MQRLKIFLVDTLMGIVFWFAVMLAYETIYCGMTFKQSLITRCGAILINAMTSGLNGRFIDFVRNRLGFTPGTERNGGLEFIISFVDTMAVVIFQIPVYLLIITTSHSAQLTLLGAFGIDQYFKELRWAVTVFPILLISVGWLYGILLDKTRKNFI